MVLLHGQDMELYTPWIGKVVVYFAHFEQAMRDLDEAIDDALEHIRSNSVHRKSPGQLEQQIDSLSGASGKMRTIMAAFDREAADDDQGPYAQRRGAGRADADGAVAHALRGPGQAGAAGAARGRGPRGGG